MPDAKIKPSKMKVDKDLFKGFPVKGKKRDRDIPDSIWNKYLNKYSNLYQIKTDADNIRYIVCKDGVIKPSSLVKKTLGAHIALTKRKKSFLISKLPFYCKVFQDAEEEVSIYFPESELNNLSNIFKIKKRKRITPELREKLQQNITSVRRNK